MKFLVVNSEMPFFDRTSMGLRLYSLMEILLEAGHKVDYFLSMPEANEKGADVAEKSRYRDILAEKGVPTLNGNFGTVLRGATYDGVIFEWYFTARDLMDAVRLWQPNARVVVDSVDVSYLRWHAKARLTDRKEDIEHARKVERAELEAYRRADMVLTLTAEEDAEIARRLPGTVTFNVPNIHTVTSGGREEAATPELLFIGSFSHEPNIDAVRYFYSEIWPRLREKRADIRWLVVGPGAPDDILGMQGDGVDVLGWVPETTSHLNRCWVSVAPLRFGAGMKGKVGEAMAAGAPVVATSFGAQGLGAEHGRDLLIADGAPEFAEAVLRFLNDPELRREIGATGRALIERSFSKGAMAKRIAEFTRLVAVTPMEEKPSWATSRRVLHRLRLAYQRYVGWRFSGA